MLQALALPAAPAPQAETGEEQEALKREVANREGWLNELENGLEKGSESRGAPKKLPQAIWDEHEVFKTRVAEYCA